MPVKLILKFGWIIGILLVLAACVASSSPRVNEFPGAHLAFESSEFENKTFIGVQWPNEETLLLESLTVSDKRPVYIGNLKTGILSSVLVGQKMISGRGPVISPDGEFVAFFDYDVKQIHIAQIGEPSKSALFIPVNGNAAWSPDGQQIAVISEVSQTITIQLFSLEGQETEKIFELSDKRIRGFGDISWSPDGKQIAFSLKWQVGVSNEVQGDIYILRLGNNEVIRLTDSDSFDDDNPSWFLDSQRLLFVSIPIGNPVNGQIQIANADGSCTKTVLRPLGVESASWSPDGSEIALSSGGRIYILSVASLGKEYTAHSLVCSVGS